MTHDEVQRWLDGYVKAWASGVAAEIGDLFTENVVYGYRPWDDDGVTVKGREAVVASWLESPDDPETWEAAYHPFVVEGDKAVAVGTTHYQPVGEHPERTYHNAWLLEFEDGQCSSFHEFWVHQKK